MMANSGNNLAQLLPQEMDVRGRTIIAGLMVQRVKELLTRDLPDRLTPMRVSNRLLELVHQMAPHVMDEEHEERTMTTRGTPPPADDVRGPLLGVVAIPDSSIRQTPTTAPSFSTASRRSDSLTIAQRR